MIVGSKRWNLDSSGNAFLTTGVIGHCHWIFIGFKTNIPRECDGHMRIGLGLETGGFRGTKDKGNSFTFSDQDLSLCVRSHEAGGRYEEHCLMLLRLGLGLGAAGEGKFRSRINKSPQNKSYKIRLPSTIAIVRHR